MIIITNFKTYDQAVGNHAIKLAQIHENITEQENIVFGVAPTVFDLEKICLSCLKIPVFAQHVDDADYGSFTGKIPPALVRKMGVSGTLLNHSENRLNYEYLEKCVKKAQEVGLSVVICAESVEEGQTFLKLEPDFIAIEPPELIGGDISVSTANPEIIKKAVEVLGSEKTIVGAGIKNSEDVRIAKELGASGILLASGVTKSANPKEVLIDLATGAKA